MILKKKNELNNPTNLTLNAWSLLQLYLIPYVGEELKFLGDYFYKEVINILSKQIDHIFSHFNFCIVHGIHIEQFLFFPDDHISFLHFFFIPF